jgi:hypothetical protein
MNKKAAGDIKLYDLPNEFERIHYLLVESDGELTPEIEEALTQAESDLETKSAAYVMVMRRLKRQGDASKAVAASIKAEMETHAAIAKSRYAACDRLEARLLAAIKACGKTKIEHEVFPVRIQNNSRPAARCLIDTHKLPDAWRKDLDPVLNDEQVMRAWKQKVALETELDAILTRYREGKSKEGDAERLDEIGLDLEVLIPEGVEVKLGTHLRY